jgi:beta-galactosidase/beta-glucuronidase
MQQPSRAGALAAVDRLTNLRNWHMLETKSGHPRPDRRRERWQSLDGQWRFALGDGGLDAEAFDRTIEVPFPYQSAASGVGITDPHDVVRYRREFFAPEAATDERVLLHFGAVDYACTVFVDDLLVGEHSGGHVPFTFDITDALDPERGMHSLAVRVVDEYRADQLRGKQTASFPFMIHYTPTTGIWQPVWLEVTGASWIRDHHVDARSDGSLYIDADVAGIDRPMLRATITLADLAHVAEGRAPLHFHCEGVEPWGARAPHRYAMRLDVLGDGGAVLDTVFGAVGFRTIEIIGDDWTLNGAPFRPRLLLDQGLWPESLLAAPSEQALIDDLKFVLEAGFDGVRKHQKIEDPRFLWHADRLGLVIWDELPSPFGLARFEGALVDHALSEWRSAIRRDRSHPCVVAWVPINESWGVQGLHTRADQRDVVRRFVAETRALDRSRPVIDNSGWGHVETDVVDVHDYDQDPHRLTQRWTGITHRDWDRGPEEFDGTANGFDLARWMEFALVDRNRTPRDVLADMIPNPRVWVAGHEPRGSCPPLVMSEFGGVGLAFGDGPRERFDYVGAADPDDLLRRFTMLVDAVERVPEMRGWCWTQLADTEQEINGLLTADRRAKVAPELLRAALAAAPWTTHPSRR